MSDNNNLPQKKRQRGFGFAENGKHANIIL
jgi:hypothetical protein